MPLENAIKYDSEWLKNISGLHLENFYCKVRKSPSVQSVQSPSRVRLLATTWTPPRQASLSITNTQTLLKLMSTESVMPSTISSSVPFFSCLQFLPASGSFQVSQFFASGGQSIGVSASASVLPMNIQD